MDKKYKKLGFKDILVKISSDEVERLDSNGHETGIIGQPRAIQALTLGTEIHARGYNIFVTGYPGTGKRTAVMNILHNIKPDISKIEDFAFVYNFKNPDNPSLIKFPAGKGKLFKKDMHNLVESLKKSIKTCIESQAYEKKRNRLIEQTQKKENKILNGFEKELNKNNFQLVQLGEEEEQVTDIIPVYNNNPIDFDEFYQLVEAGEVKKKVWDEYMSKYCQFMEDLKEIIKQVKVFRKELNKNIKNLSKESIMPFIQSELEVFKQKYKTKNVKNYLKLLEKDVIQNIFLFARDQNTKDLNGNRAFIRYGVNIIVDRTESEHVPIIFENFPTNMNLFGTIENKIGRNGQVNTTFLNIKAGSLIQASGGFLVLQAEDILQEENVWQKLKNVLKTDEVVIHHSENAFIPQMSLIKPEPVKIDVKVIVVGDPNVYEVLYSMDEDFQKLFKVTAEFDSEIERTENNISKYISFIKSIIKREKLRKITPEGIAAIIKHGIRISARKERLTTRFSLIKDIICESDYWAKKNKSNVINPEDVKKAIEVRNYLSNLPEEKIQEMIIDGDILISVKGKTVGKINALTVHDRGYYSFGRPALITVQTTPGDIGVINIEREAGLSGEFHNKGVLILDGIIRSRYARDFPLSITASICFEQSYSHIDGDSATAAEVCALLSAISEIPISQEYAVTGSVNQMGEIQPIGGVTEKVEGFFNICSKKGMTGKQGVIIPHQNVQNLILSDMVLEAVKKKKFHIFTVKHIDEVLELFTGLVIGKRDNAGNYPENTFNWIVEKRLKKMADQVKNYSHGKD